MSDESSRATPWITIVGTIVAALITATATIIAADAKQEQVVLAKRIDELQRQNADLTGRFDKLQQVKPPTPSPDALATISDLRDDLRKAQQESADLRKGNASLVNDSAGLPTKIEAGKPASASISRQELQTQTEIRLPLRDSAQTTGVVTWGINNGALTSIHLYECARDGEMIACYFVMKRGNGGELHYQTDRKSFLASRLVDTFNNHEHDLLRDYFLVADENRPGHLKRKDNHSHTICRQQTQADRRICWPGELANQRQPFGWHEPGQTPEFDKNAPLRGPSLNAKCFEFDYCPALTVAGAAVGPNGKARFNSIVKVVPAGNTAERCFAK